MRKIYRVVIVLALLVLLCLIFTPWGWPLLAQFFSLFGLKIPSYTDIGIGPVVVILANSIMTLMIFSIDKDFTIPSILSLISLFFSFSTLLGWQGFWILWLIVFFMSLIFWFLTGMKVYSLNARTDEMLMKVEELNKKLDRKIQELGNISKEQEEIIRGIDNSTNKWKEIRGEET